VAWLARRDDQHTPDGSGENFEQAEDTASESAVGTLDEAFAALSGGY